MGHAGTESGMAQLVVDDQDIGAVYYEILGLPSSGGEGIRGTLSGDPFALRQALQEKGTRLALESGRKVSIEITEIDEDRGVAQFRQNIEMPALDPHG